MKAIVKPITRHLWQFLTAEGAPVGFVRRCFEGTRTFYTSRLDATLAVHEDDAKEQTHETMDEAVLALRSRLDACDRGTSVEIVEPPAADRFSLLEVD